MNSLRLLLRLVIVLQIFSVIRNSKIADIVEINNNQNAILLPKPMAKLERNEKSMIELRTREYSNKSKRPTMMDVALQMSAKEGLDAMNQLYNIIQPEILKTGQILEHNHPAALLSKFSAPSEESIHNEMAAFATLSAAKAFKKNYKQSNYLGRQAHAHKISLRRTPLESLCPPRDPPICFPVTQRYRTFDGTCNNNARPRWGSAQMPFSRFMPPEYGDGIDTIRLATDGDPLSSARIVSLMVHGAKDGDAPITLMIAQWGQLLDHDLTSTAQPRSINGSIPKCCGNRNFHPSCFPIKVPLDDPWLAPLKIQCLEFLRSAPAHRRDCVLSWREQINQVTSFIDASPIYSSSSTLSTNGRLFRNGQLIFGRDNSLEDECIQGALAHHCIRSADARSGEQPGLLALHHVWVGEHNRISLELKKLNPHWSDEKLYQETRRIIGALFQHITYREFLPIVLGREVCRLFDLDLKESGYYHGYNETINPTVANSFSTAAFRFGHSLVQGSYMRCDRHHNLINNSVSLHEEFLNGDVGTPGSLHRLLRGLASQRAMKRDEFITAELTNHLFQTPGFPFGLDLAAINIQRGRDHGIAPYTSWREPCGLSPVNNWEHFAKVVGPESAKRISNAYRSVHDIDLFVGGIAERPVVGGLIGPTFACIIAQQFSNLRRGDRFWYENPGFESSFTPYQLDSLRRVSLAQILCRAVGGGTFQPHIFMPSEFPGNQRLPCGVGVLAPIDLSPWLEETIFTSLRPSTLQSVIPDITLEVIKTHVNEFSIIKKSDFVHNTNLTKGTFIELTPESTIQLHRPPNITKINDKIDFNRKATTGSLVTLTGISNKIDQTGPESPKRKKLRRKGTNIRKRLAVATIRRANTGIIPRKNPIQDNQNLTRQEPDMLDRYIDNAISTKKRTNIIDDDRNENNNIYNNIERELRTEESESGSDSNSTTEPSNVTMNLYLTDSSETKMSPTTIPKYNLTTTILMKTSGNLSELTNLLKIHSNDDLNYEHMESYNFQKQDLQNFNCNETKTTKRSDLDKNFFELNITKNFNDDCKRTNDSVTFEKNNIKELNSVQLRLNNIFETNLNNYEKNQNSDLIDTVNDSRIIRINLRRCQYSNSNKFYCQKDFDKNKTVAESTIRRIQYRTNLRQKLRNEDNIIIETKDQRQKPELLTEQKRQTEDIDIDPVFRSPTEKSHIRITRSIKIQNGLKSHVTNSSFIDNIKRLIPKNDQLKTNNTHLSQQTMTTRSSQYELRQFQTKRTHVRPENIIVDGQDSDEYEIEINIRQKGQTKPSNFFHDKHDSRLYPNSHETRTKPPVYDYFGQLAGTTQYPAYFPQSQRTKPPTVIYLNDQDYKSTTRPSGILQNLLSFTTNSFGNRKGEHSTTSNRIVNSEYPSGSPFSPTYNGHHNYPSLAGSASNANAGLTHASSSAISTGNFGVISGSANVQGSDSTFSFNIRPRPGSIAHADQSSALVHYPTEITHSHQRPNRPDSSPFSSSLNRPHLNPFYTRASSHSNLPLQRDANYNHIQPIQKQDKQLNESFGENFNHTLLVNDNTDKENKNKTNIGTDNGIYLNSLPKPKLTSTELLREDYRDDSTNLQTSESFTKLIQLLTSRKKTKHIKDRLFNISLINPLLNGKRTKV